MLKIKKGFVFNISYLKGLMDLKLEARKISFRSFKDLGEGITKEEEKDFMQIKEI